ncbi:hypothetical protein [Microbulbifer hainanensis]|uniref:hypothetical protein n=1 Tax=Microbulbifer hainanensis TaxID=2735675 RepID=UPI00186902F4|nr:hypothetical protein [Microbulbifer hainanensis]
MSRITLLLLTLVFAVALGACGQRAEKKAEQVPEVTEEPAQEPEMQAEELIWVYEARGDKQCEQGGTTLEESSAKLTDSGVEVQESRCGVRTDRMYPSVCGGETGNILLHLISQDKLDAALEMGFDPADQVEYQNQPCP